MMIDNKKRRRALGSVYLKHYENEGDNGDNGNENEGGNESGGNEKPVDISNYLTVIALEDGLTAALSGNTVEYCIDGDGNWKTLASNTNSESINKGQTLSFRGNLTPTSNNRVGRFTITKSCDLTGNCNSLLFGDDAKSNNSLSGKDYAFYYLFNNCTTIKNVSSNFLPATTLTKNCYQYMFYGCSSLTKAPELPATTLAEYCYSYMFYGCKALTTAPSILPAKYLYRSCYGGMFSGCSKLTTTPTLPATTLDEYCYERMFAGCTSLTTTPALPATTLAPSCYNSMFLGTNLLPDCSNIDFSSSSVVSSGGLRGLFADTKVTDNDLRNILPVNSSGDYCLPCTRAYSYCYSYMFEGCKLLTTAPTLPATTLYEGCYYDMFSGCTSLTTAPTLPATTLANYCYYYMFNNCTSLTTAPTVPATTLATYCYSGIFQQCTSLTTAPTLPATTLASSCYSNMFSGCILLKTAPQLPATTLANRCYEYMFSGCKNLKYIKAMFTTTPSTTYTAGWVSGVASSGKFVKNKNATWNVTATSDNNYIGTPSGWTVQTA